jgi:hypothetical protein
VNDGTGGSESYGFGAEPAWVMCPPVLEAGSSNPSSRLEGLRKVLQSP